MGGNKVRKEILTAFSRNLIVITGGEDKVQLKEIGGHNF